MKLYIIFAALFIVGIQKSQTVYAKVEVTNVKCLSVDKPFADFEYCYLKSINRTYKYISVKAKLFQVPINNISLNISLKKRANGYKPFLYNVTIDACAFLRGRSNRVLDFFYGLIKNHTNTYHKCPFDHDIVMDRLDYDYLDNQMTKVLPMPDGDYGFFTTWFAYNIPRAKFDVFLKVSY